MSGHMPRLALLFALSVSVVGSQQPVVFWEVVGERVASRAVLVDRSELTLARAESLAKRFLEENRKGRRFLKLILATDRDDVDRHGSANFWARHLPTARQKFTESLARRSLDRYAGMLMIGDSAVLRCADEKGGRKTLDLVGHDSLGVRA